MGLGTWLNDFFFGNSSTGQEPAQIAAQREALATASYKYLAVNSCINFIASVISLATFKYSARSRTGSTWSRTKTRHPRRSGVV